MFSLHNESTPQRLFFRRRILYYTVRMNDISNESIILYDRSKRPVILHYTLKRSSRRTMAVYVMEDARVEVRAPHRIPAREIEAFLRDKEGWILKKKSEQEKKRSLVRENDLTDSQQKSLEKVYREAASRYIPQRVAHYAPLVGVTYGRIFIRSQKTAWGSCSSAGNLSFNWKLMLAPPRVLDYVVVHELCHRIHMDHSAAFWASVEKILPDYREHRKWLRDYGQLLDVKSLRLS